MVYNIIMKICKRCKDRVAACKDMCTRCYYATKRGYKTKVEQLDERNFIRDGAGILTDKGGNEWVVDLEDFERCKSHFWTGNGSGYAKAPKVGYLHRYITPDWKTVDHIDRNPRNCRRDNLRDGRGINNLNKPHSAKSGYKGVHRMKDKWQARPMRKCLGTFDTPEEAHRAIINWAEPLGLKEFYVI